MRIHVSGVMNFMVLSEILGRVTQKKFGFLPYMRSSPFECLFFG